MSIMGATEWSQFDMLDRCYLHQQAGCITVRNSDTHNKVNFDELVNFTQAVFDDLKIDIFLSSCTLFLIKEQWGAWLDDVYGANELGIIRKYANCDAFVKETVTTFYDMMCDYADDYLLQCAL